MTQYDISDTIVAYTTVAYATDTEVIMPKIMKSLNSISRCQSTYRSVKLSADGICACHHSFILIISRHPGYSQEDITREICLNKSTVARTLNHLESVGYITRIPDSDDKRRILVYPTEKMLLILPKVRAVSKDWNDRITEGISDEEMQVFHSVLSRMEQRAKEIIGEL